MRRDFPICSMPSAESTFPGLKTPSQVVAVAGEGQDRVTAVRPEMTVMLLFHLSWIVPGVHVQDETIFPFLLDQSLAG